MNQTEYDALSAEYAVACKRYTRAGTTNKGRFVYDKDFYLDVVIPDFLSDEADVWRRVEALECEGHTTTFLQKGSGERGVIVNGEGYWFLSKEATLRACIALKVMVP